MDRTYTGLQTLGAETVVDVELHRHSLGEDSVYPQSSESDISDAPPSLPLTIPAPVKASSPVKQSHEPVPDTSVEKGSPISTPSPSPLPRTPTSTPVHVKQGTASSVINNPYVIVDKPGQVIGATTPTAGSPTSKLSTASQPSQGTGSPIPKIHGSSFVTSAVKVIIKQEPGEASHVPTTGAASQSPLPQYVTVKGGHMIAVSPQKQVLTAGEGTAQSPKIQPSKLLTRAGTWFIEGPGTVQEVKGCRVISLAVKMIDVMDQLHT
ncbi:YEATS domain-containing protein 2 isoform X2 [Pontoporia blainvillei]|uniref:YEATS domain-containing protein 2 isoform X2 n=1 Tax=Pontoporia blainvillei TaxID=48723 RepID=A0ABX0S4D7_PONBL|nr:YEATS domain-containing protein 2 isoform X2 [Pontoporia blainvillei]